MSEQVDVLMTIPYPEELLEKLRNISARLHIHTVKASRVDEIPADLWVAAEILYTGRIIPAPEVAPNLRWIQFHYAGIDHAREAPILAKEGLFATTMSGASASQVAEYILMMLLALGHRLPEMTEQQRKSSWPKDRWERFSPPRAVRGHCWYRGLR